MDPLYLKGELLQVHTKSSETVEGRFYSISEDKSRISLYRVKELPNSVESNGIFHYYNSEITNIIKMNNPEDMEVNAFRNLKISQKECEEVIKISHRYIYINQVDNNFHEAMQELNQYEYIALSTDGASMGRKCKMPFLIISSPNQIYIFDTQVMQFHAFEAGLKKLLESECPKKIIHDSRKISDCLYNKHNVELTSVFDTQVAHLIIMKNKNGILPKEVKSLQECLNIYLGLPMNINEDQLDILKCTTRPLASDIKDALAKNIAYLHKLSEIMNEEMLLPFVRGVECFVKHLRTCDDYKAFELSGKHNQIPKEFSSAIEY